MPSNTSSARTRPTTTVEHGRPGGYARLLAGRRSRPVVVATAVAVAATVVGIVRWGDGSTTVGGVLLGLAAGAVTVARTLSGGVRRALHGAGAEETVAAALRRCGVQQVVHGALLGAGGDADHLLIGPYLAVVETKSGRGHVSADEHGVRVGGRPLPGNPIRQARRQAAAAGRIVGGWADAIVCVTHMSNPPLQVGSTVVCSANDLPGVVNGLGHRVGHQVAAKVAADAANGAYSTRQRGG